jgi:hypothetical protein
LKTETLVAIPLLSIGIVYAIAKFLHVFDIWDVQFVQGVLAAIFVVSLVRLRGVLAQGGQGLITIDWRLVSVICVLLLPIFAELATAPFDSDDENTSWNYWAKLAFFGEPSDFFYTKAPYPQLFSILLSSNYALLGEVSYQLPVKAGLWMISLSCFGALAIFTAQRLGKLSALGVVLFVVYAVDLRGEYRVALADPLMSSFLLLGFYFLFLNGDDRNTLRRLWLAGLFLSLGALTKQAALPWAILFFPVIYITVEFRNLRLPQYWAPMLLPPVVAILWLLTEGYGALNNQGVLNASLQGRGFLEQLLFALGQYSAKPELIITYTVFIGTILWKPSIRKIITGVALLTSTVLWLLYGSYQYRLGMHNFLLAWFFIVLHYSELSFDLGKTLSTNKVRGWITGAVIALLVASVSYSGLAVHKRLRSTGSISLLDGLGRQAWSFLGYEGDQWINELTASDGAKVLVLSNYINGMLAPTIKIFRMQDVGASDDPEKISEYIERRGISHLIVVANPLYQWGPGNQGLQQIVSSCPQKYVLVSGARGNPIGLFIDLKAKLFRVTAASC